MRMRGALRSGRPTPVIRGYEKAKHPDQNTRITVGRADSARRIQCNYDFQKEAFFVCALKFLYFGQIVSCSPASLVI